MGLVSPFTFNGVRSIIGGLVLIPVILVLDRKRRQKERIIRHLVTENTDLRRICCGVALCVASNFQQFGVMYTSVGKVGFITACYIIIVPILSLFLGKSVRHRWGAVAVAGLYLLCMSGSDHGLQKGDFLIMICSFIFSIHIMIIDYFSPAVDGVKMSCIQFLVSGIISLICMTIFEEPHIAQILAAWKPILYAGVMSCGMGYTLQIVGQKGVNPASASLILSLESSISVLAGWLILGQKLTGREILGCVLMFSAIVLAQVPDVILSRKTGER
ncbi:MAG: DMT family transporter [Clostridium sp.]